MPTAALAADVEGTEYCPGTNGTIYAHVLYVNGTPANSATVTMSMWAPDGTKYLDSVSMSYVTGSNGMYSYDFITPSAEGVYAVDVSTTNPAGYGADEVHIADCSGIITTSDTTESDMTISNVLLLVGIAVLAFWRRETLVYFLAFFCALFIGAGWFDVSMPLGIAVMFLGGVMLLNGIIQIVRGETRF